MKYKNSKSIYRRKIGQPRKSQSIYDNLGHPYKLIGKIVIFIGKEEKAYSLTNGKEYTVIYHANPIYNWDKDLREKCRKMKHKNYETYQGEDYFLRIINDKGHKRKYSHLMFKLKQSAESSTK